MLNQCNFYGKLAKDVVFKETEHGRMALFTLAVWRKYKSKNGKRKVDYIRFKAEKDWLIEYLETFAYKQGSTLIASGSLEVDNVGPKWYTQINCDFIFMPLDKIVPGLDKFVESMEALGLRQNDEVVDLVVDETEDKKNDWFRS